MDQYLIDITGVVSPPRCWARSSVRCW